MNIKQRYLILPLANHVQFYIHGQTEVINLVKAIMLCESEIFTFKLIQRCQSGFILQRVTGVVYCG